MTYRLYVYRGKSFLLCTIEQKNVVVIPRIGEEVEIAQNVYTVTNVRYCLKAGLGVTEQEVDIEVE